MTDYCVAVIVGEIDDPVLPPEWPEELNFQLSVTRVLHNKCLALDIGLLAVYTVPVTSVLHNYIILISQCIFSIRAIASFLK